MFEFPVQHCIDSMMWKRIHKIKLSIENPIALHDDTVTLKPVFSLYKKNHHSLLLGKRFSKSLKDQFIL